MIRLSSLALKGPPSLAGLGGDPERLRNLIDRRKSMIKKMQSTAPKKKPITDHYLPNEYKEAKVGKGHARYREPDEKESTFSADDKIVLNENWSIYQQRLREDQKKRMLEYKKSQIAALEELHICFEIDASQ